MTDNVDHPSEPVADDAVSLATAETAPAIAAADDVEHRLDPNSVTVSRLAGGIAAAVLLVAQLVALFGMLLAGAGGIWILLVFGIFVVVLGLFGSAAWFWPSLRYRYAAYRVNERGIQIRDGVLWRSITTVPRSRVQHTDVSQGPIARAYGIATLIIHTAGTEHASVTLDGLPRDKADAIRDHLIEGGEGDAV